MSERIGLAFLGTNDYGPAFYTWHGDRITPEPTKYVQSAVQEAFDLDRFFVAMTEEARTQNGDALADQMELEPLSIPQSSGEEQFWNVFDALAGAVPSGADLTIDVTHGFRSLPVVGLSIAVYLQASSHAEVERIVYGEFSGENQEAPLRDLTPFLSLIEWSVAARQLLRDGSAEALAALMDEIQGTAYRTGAEVKPKHAQTAAGRLESLTDALSVVQPQDVGGSGASSLTGALQKVQSDVERVPQLRPLAVLLEKIRDRLAPMEASSLFGEEGFRAQAEMMEFFLETGQLQQAVTLAREALVSFQAIRMGYSPEPLPRSEEDGRDRAENALNALADTDSDKRTEEGGSLADLWSGVREVRNYINHAGMNPKSYGVETLKENVEEVVSETAEYLRSQFT
jgi:CRISPR-associated DxTHG motif protein